jgi:serine/threonine protein kinase
MGQKCCKDLLGGGSDSEDDGLCGCEYGTTAQRSGPPPRNASFGSSLDTTHNNSPATHSPHSLGGHPTACPCGCGLAHPCPEGHRLRRQHNLTPPRGIHHSHSVDSVHSAGSANGDDHHQHNHRGKGDCKPGFWRNLKTPRRKKACPPVAAPPKRASGWELLDRTQVVCLLGTGAFGSVSLVFQRPTPLGGGGAGGGPLAAHGPGPSPMIPGGHGPHHPHPHPLLGHALSADNIDALAHGGQHPAGTVTPPLLSASPSIGNMALAAAPSQRSQTLEPPLETRHRRAMSSPGLAPAAHAGRVTPPAALSLAPQHPASSHHPPPPASQPAQRPHANSGLLSPPNGSVFGQPTYQRGMPGKDRAQLRSTDDVGSVGSSAANSFAFNSFSVSQAAVGRRVRFSVLKRISKQKQAQMRGNKVDIAAERFRSEGLVHPFVMRLLQAAQTPSDYYNVYPFALGGDVGLLLNRHLSQVLTDVTTMANPGENFASLTKALARRCTECRPAPSACSCTRLASFSEPPVGAPGHGSHSFATAQAPVDSLCPVAQWSATEGGLALPTLMIAAFEVLAAVQYLASHPSRITHGDLKPDNVFISETGHMWLGDFSMMTCDVAPAAAAPAADVPKKRPSGLQALNKSFGIFGGGQDSPASASASGAGTAAAGGGRTPSANASGNTSASGFQRSDSHTTNSHSHIHTHGGADAVSNSASRTIERNPRYMPPEVVMGQWKPLEAGPTDPVPEPVVDMWSYGVMLQELATGAHPFFPPGTPMQSQPAMMALVRAVREPVPSPLRPNVALPRSDATPDEIAKAELEAEQAFDGVCEVIDHLNDLIAKCLRPEPAKRLTPSAALYHPLFRHPLVLAHLGILPAAIAAEASHRLARNGYYPSEEAADNALFFADTDRVNWAALDGDGNLSTAFLDVLWDRFVLVERLCPQIVPRDVCVNNGYSVPDDVNLSLTGTDLLNAFAQSAGVVTNHSFQFSNFDTSTQQSLTTRMPFASPQTGVAPPPPPPRSTSDVDMGSGTLTPSLYANGGATAAAGGAAGEYQQPQHAFTPVPHTSGGGSRVQFANTAGGGGAGTRGSNGGVAAISPQALQGSALPNTSLASPAYSGGAANVNFGDPRIPPFCPVDLRFFATSQADYDLWDDDRNKKRLARTDAEMRAESEAAVQLQQDMASKPATKAGGKGAKNAPVATAQNQDFLANYTYRGFDSTALFR